MVQPKNTSGKHNDALALSHSRVKSLFSGESKININDKILTFLTKPQTHCAAHLTARGRTVDDDAVDGGGGAVVHRGGRGSRPRPPRRRVDVVAVVGRGGGEVVLVVVVVVHVPAAAALHGAAAIGASWNGVAAGAPGESKNEQSVTTLEIHFAVHCLRSARHRGRS